MNSKTITIKFVISSDSAWTINLLENGEVLRDLSDRTVREFGRDLAKMCGFTSAVGIHTELLEVDYL